MKKLMVCIAILLCVAGTALAQQKPTPSTDSIVSWIERVAAEREAERLKSYYTDRTTANICEAWDSCAKWAFEEYTQDQTFKVVKAQFITQRKTYQNRTVKETHLLLEAKYEHRTVRLEFVTPKANGRKRPYNYIAKFPEK